MNEKDVRIRFIADFILKTYKLRPDCWAKCIGLDENRKCIEEFLEKGGEIPQLVFTGASSGGGGGTITPSYKFPTSLKNGMKAVYFIKKRPEPVSQEGVKTALIYGDLSYSPLEQLSALVDEVRHRLPYVSRLYALPATIFRGK